MSHVARSSSAVRSASRGGPRANLPMRIVVAALLIIHGVAHLPGFVVSWRLAAPREMPYKTTLFAGLVNVGDAGIRVVGMLWLMAALALGACGIVVLVRAPWWMPVTLTAAL